MPLSPHPTFLNQWPSAAFIIFLAAALAAGMHLSSDPAGASPAHGWRGSEDSTTEKDTTP